MRRAGGTVDRPASRTRLRLSSPGAPESNGGTARPPDGLVRPLFAALSGRGIPAAVVRIEDEEVVVLVPRSHRREARSAAVAAGLVPISADPLRGDRYAAPVSASATAWRVRAVTALRYGRILRCLGTGERTERTLGRRVMHNGIPHLAPADRAVDVALHALLDHRSIPPARQRELRHLMEELRREPVHAGRAAERVQRELSPAVSWAALLGDVVLGRWGELARRRRALARHLFRRRPLRTLRAAVRDASRRLSKGTATQTLPTTAVKP